MPSENASGIFLVALSYFTAPCIGLFFMVSGALLLPVKMSYFNFLKRRLSKVVIPTLLWTAIYLCLNIYFSESEINILQSIASVPFSAQGQGVLWFMYTLTGLYLLAPIISPWLTSAANKEIIFVLILWCITLCYPLLKFGVITNTNTTGILYYFTGYAGYFCLGYFLKHRIKKCPFILPLFISFLGTALLTWMKIVGIEFDFYELFWYESIFIAALCCLYWACIKNLMRFKSFFSRYAVIINKLSSLSFGIYFIHILIMRFFLWNTSFIKGINNYIFQSLTIAIVTFVISVLVCAGLSKSAIGKWTIGYSDRKKC